MQDRERGKGRDGERGTKYTYRIPPSGYRPTALPPYRLPYGLTIILPGTHTRPGAPRPKEGDMTRQYEVVYIFDSALEEAAINERLARFHALIHQPDGEAPQVNHWGKRTLAYPVKKHETGYYVVAKFDAEATTLPEFERAIKLDGRFQGLRRRRLRARRDGHRPGVRRSRASWSATA